MAKVESVEERREALLAKKDEEYVDANGVSRKVFADTVVPYDLREEAGIEPPYGDSGTVQKSDDAGEEGDDEIKELPGDETLITPPGTEKSESKSTKKK